MYSKTVKLKDNESLAKINQETGEVIVVGNRANNIPDGKEVFEPNGRFQKSYTKTWEYLDKVLSPLEFKVTAKLCRMAQINTNSLEPLNDETTAVTLAQEFDLDHRKAKKLFRRLFELGVYAKFEAYKPSIKYTKYWLLNPYLSFNGKIINSDIRLLFVGTILEKVYNNKL